MFFNFGFKSSILLIYFFNGVVFSTLLAIKGFQYKNKSTLWLSLFVLLGTLYITPFMLGYAGWYSKNPYREILFYIPFQQLFLMPPVLYFYIRTLLDKSFKFSKRDVIHFLPTICYIIYSLIIFFNDKVFVNELYFYKDQKDKDFASWYQVSGFVWMCIYLLPSLKVYYRYRYITYHTVSFADTILFGWIKKFLIVFFGNKFWYYLCFSCLLYYISISGYTNYMQSIIPFTDRLNVVDVNLGNNINNFNAKYDPEIERFQQEEFNQLKSQIEKIMLEEQMFKKQDLTLQDFSLRLNLNTKKTSQVINQCFNMNFNDFVNHYRTEEVIRILKSDQPNLFTLLSIALDCGFNSKSTFNRAFKKHTAVTPKEYLEQYRKM